MLAAVIVVIMLVPIKRYTLPASLPFHLEPYRLLILLVAVAWITSLLIDPRVRLRASGLEGPIALFALAALASVSANAQRIESTGLTPVVTKTLTFFASFFVLFYAVVSLVSGREQLNRLLRILAGAAVLVAAAALIEYRTHDNLFNHLGQVVPFLHFQDPKLTAGLDTSYLDRAGSARAYASSAHPIELSAVLVMIIPIAVYLDRLVAHRRWLLCGAILGAAALATLSRTGVVMLVVTGFVFLRLRPRETSRLWPAVLPMLIVVYFALPHTLGSFYSAFFPQGGLVAQQSEQDATNKLTADGRLADVRPSLSEAARHPILGEGFGTRVTDRVSAAQYHVPRSRILDDQWLGSLLETGVVGVVALLWLFRRTGRRLRTLARADDGPDGWLAAGLVAAVTSFAVGMLTFDALGFVQVTLVLFLLLAFSCVLVRLRAHEV
jgi:O-Antigen ligase